MTDGRADEATDEMDASTALVVLARLSSACMEQARWFDYERPGDNGRKRNAEAALTWAARAEELLAWVFEEWSPKQIAWSLMGITEGQEER